MPPDVPTPEASRPRRRFIAILDQFDNWLQSEKENGTDAVSVNPALVKALKTPIPAPRPVARPAPAAPAPPQPRPPAQPAPAMTNPAPILFVAPPPASAESEDLLLKMIKAMGLADRDYVLLRAGAAEGSLVRGQIADLKPALVVTLDEDAWRAAAGKETESLATVRGTWKTIGGVAAMPTYGPAYLLTRPAEKKTAWKDLQTVLARLGRTAPPVKK